MNLWRPKRRNGALSASIGISIASALSSVVRRLSRVLSIEDRQLLVNTILDGERCCARVVRRCPCAGMEMLPDEHLYLRHILIILCQMNTPNDLAFCFRRCVRQLLVVMRKHEVSRLLLFPFQGYSIRQIRFSCACAYICSTAWRVYSTRARRLRAATWAQSRCVHQTNLLTMGISECSSCAILCDNASSRVLSTILLPPHGRSSGTSPTRQLSIVIV